MTHPSPIELLSEKLTEYKRALEKSFEAYRSGLITFEVHDSHKSNIEPKIKNYTAAIENLKTGFKMHRNTRSIKQIRESISFLKNNGFERLEKNSYANDLCNVVFEFHHPLEKPDYYCFAVCNNEGDVRYSPDLDFYWLVGCLIYHDLIPKNYIKLEKLKK